MAVLTFDCSAAMTASEKQAFARRVTDLYAERMDTETDHVAVAIRERTEPELSIGRADPEQPCLILEAEVRQDHGLEERRAFALGVMDLAHRAWRIPEPNMKVVFTEHAGEDVTGADHVGGE